jgi:acyl dehydratase
MPVRSFDRIADLQPHVGEELGASDWFEVTQERINAFADATDDRQWIHTDTERARVESPSGRTIAHGFLTLSLLSPLFASALEVGNTTTSINYGLNRVRFTSPVQSGDRIRARFTLQQYQALDAGAQLTWNVLIERSGESKPVVIAEWLMRRIQ